MTPQGVWKFINIFNCDLMIMSVVGIALRKILKAGIETYLDSREAKKKLQKRLKFLEAYISKIPDSDERNALLIFATFPLDDTESAIKNLREQLESEEEKESLLRDHFTAVSTYNLGLRFRSNLTPEALEKFKKVEARVQVLEQKKKLCENPELRDRVFFHFYRLNKQIETMDEPPT